MRRNLLFALFFILTLVFLATTSALGVLYLNNKTITDQLNWQVSSYSSQVSSLTSQVSQLSQQQQPKMLSFTDIGAGVSLKYPSDWTLSSNVPINFNPTTAIATTNNYQVLLTKGNATLTFSLILVGRGIFPQPLIKGSSTYQLVGDKVIRSYINTDTSSTNWNYTMKEDNSVCNNALSGGTTKIDYCISATYAGFDKKYSVTATINKSADAALITEADGIITANLN